MIKIAVVRLNFSVTCNSDDENIDEIGKELAVFLRESFFNGEDVLDVEYTGSEIIS